MLFQTRDTVARVTRWSRAQVVLRGKNSRQSLTVIFPVLRRVKPYGTAIPTQPVLNLPNKKRRISPAPHRGALKNTRFFAATDRAKTREQRTSMFSAINESQAVVKHETAPAANQHVFSRPTVAHQGNTGFLDGSVPVASHRLALRWS
jgi:hypothetical protein